MATNTPDKWPGTPVPEWPGTVVSKPPLPPEIKPEAMGAGERFLTGVADPLVGGQQMLSHITGSPEDVKRVDEQVKAREEAIKAREGGGFMRGLGGAVGTAPAMAIGGPLGGIPGAMIGGALAGTLEPSTGKDYLENKVQQAFMGAAFGGMGGGSTKMLGTVVGPTVREAADSLMKAGVKLTPGQIAGGYVRRAEEIARSVPILGAFIRNAEGHGIEDFNRVTINQALSPINIALPSGMMGRDAIAYGRGRLQDAYDTLLPQMQLVMDPQLSSDVSLARFWASELPDAQGKQFETILKNRIAKPFLNTGAISGTELKKSESELTRIINNYRGSANAGDRDLAHLLDDVRGAVRDALTRQNPTHAGELKKINEAYAMWARVENAAARRAGEGGVFTPPDLLQSIKQSDRSIRKSAFARGDALMQDWAEIANLILPNKVPDSGTPERIALMELMKAGAGAFAAEQTPYAGRYTVPVLGGIGVSSLPYTKPGIAAANKIAQPGPVRKAIGSGIRSSSPYTGTASAPILQQIFGGD